MDEELIHTKFELHHGHQHASGSMHSGGHHQFLLENINVVFEDLFYKKCSLFPLIKKTQVLKNLNLSLHEGEKLFIIGQTGSGKSMLINLLTGNLPSNANVDGNIWFHGNLIESHELKNLMRGKVSYIPQSLASLDPMQKYGIGDKELYPVEMSGGMKRIALVNDAINPNSEIIIADEPTTNLDFENKEECMSLILDKANQGCTLVVITHDVELALKYGDRIAIFKDNTMVDEISVSSFKNEKDLTCEYSKRLFESLPENLCFSKFEEKNNNQKSHELKINNLNFGYSKTEIFKNYSLKVASGEITCFFGPTGSGKSTICKILSGHIVPAGIDVFLDGKKLSVFKDVQLVVQDPHASFNPNVAVGKSFDVNFESESSLFDELGLDMPLLSKFPRELSGGELARLSIARALISYPKFLILDESTASLDVVTQKEILDFLIEWCEDNFCGLVFVSHDFELVKKLATKIVYF